MPRKPRFFLPGVPAHIMQRDQSHAPVFFEEVLVFLMLNNSFKSENSG